LPPASFQIGNVRVGGGELFLIAGPCVIESEEHAVKMAEVVKGVARSLKIPYIFKASYDKANRTSIGSYRGPGIEEGLRILHKIQQEVGVPVLTDVHEIADVERVAEAVDVIQIPAFLCRQTDLLLKAAQTGRAVNIKKGQFAAPWDMEHAVEKCRATANPRVFVTERGASFCAGSHRWFSTPHTPCNFRPQPALTKAQPPVEGNLSLFPCFRARLWLPAWMEFLWKFTTIRRKPSPMGPMHWT